MEAAAAEGNQKAIAAIEAYNYRVAKYIGAYAAAMQGVDVIAFTAGVGENNQTLRTGVCNYLGWLGTTIDPEKNKLRGEEVILSQETDKVQVLIVPTNEELAIARETVRLVK